LIARIYILRVSPNYIYPGYRQIGEARLFKKFPQVKIFLTQKNKIGIK